MAAAAIQSDRRSRQHPHVLFAVGQDYHVLLNKGDKLRERTRESRRAIEQVSGIGKLSKKDKREVWTEGQGGVLAYCRLFLLAPPQPRGSRSIVAVDWAIPCCCCCCGCYCHVYHMNFRSSNHNNKKTLPGMGNTLPACHLCLPRRHKHHGRDPSKPTSLRACGLKLGSIELGFGSKTRVFGIRRRTSQHGSRPIHPMPFLHCCACSCTLSRFFERYHIAVCDPQHTPNQLQAGRSIEKGQNSWSETFPAPPTPHGTSHRYVRSELGRLWGVKRRKNREFVCVRVLEHLERRRHPRLRRGHTELRYSPGVLEA